MGFLKLLHGTKKRKDLFDIACDYDGYDIVYEEETTDINLYKFFNEITDGMDWSDMNRHLLLLQDKLNTYIWYIDSGQYKEKYPNVKSVELRVSFLFEEPEICRKLLERAKQVFVDVFENVEMIVEHGTK